MARSAGRQRQLDHAVAALESRHGAGVLRRAAELVHHVPHLPTGFDALDHLTGCGGIPLGAMSLLSGPATSGKTTVAYKLLAAAQRAAPKQAVALLDLHATPDPDYLARAGVDLARLLLLQPAPAPQAVDLLVDLAQSRGLALLVVDSLSDYAADRALYRRLSAVLGRLHQALRATRCTLVWLDDPAPAWLRLLALDRSSAVRQWAALHVELQLEQWLTSQAGVLRGYLASAKLLKSRWAKAGRRVPLAIEFNGTVKARSTW